MTKKKTNIMKVWDWIFISSANPQKTSLTIKGILTLAIPTFLPYLNDLGLNYAQADVVHVITVFSAVVGICLTAFGLFRKMGNSIGNK